MKKKYRIVIPIVIVALLLVFNQCKSDPPESIVLDIPALEIISPANNQMYTIGEEVTVALKINSPEDVSNLKLYVGGILVSENIPSGETSITFDTKDLPVGNLDLELFYNSDDDNQYSRKQKITFFSDIIPEMKTVKILEELPHNGTSYTQGFEFYKGAMYESTGQYGTSYIAEVDPKSGTLLRKKDLISNYFGEGITILDSVIYQLTWQAGLCKQYDMDFNEIGESTYVGDGWGLTNNGEQLIMSNGSDKIFWRDPETMDIIKELYIFDNQSSAVQINELELIGNRLFANIYTENEIIEIDTANGKILSRIDCSEIVNMQPVSVDYFNGIAYDSVTDKIYVTGKLYPSKYVVSFE
ncbi:MAG: glutamine cyclotransferase [Arenicella sp.]|jgi:glutamine cyclotransferase